MVKEAIYTTDRHEIDMFKGHYTPLNIQHWYPKKQMDLPLPAVRTNLIRHNFHSMM